MGLEQIVNVQISRQTGGVTQAGFGTPMILGNTSSELTVGQIKTYSSLTAVLEDFASSDAEYVAASKIFAQTPKPPQIKIARHIALVAQVSTHTPNVSSQTVQAFTVTINGTLFSFTSDSDPTAAEVVTGLISLINAGTEPVTASGTTTLILTADNAGQPFTIANSANMPATSSTASVGYPEAFAAISAVDDDWYAVVGTVKTQWAILAIAAYIETQRKIYGVSIEEADALDIAEEGDTGSLLKIGNYFRTFWMYSAVSETYPEAAWFGRVLPLSPGSETWAYKTLAGVATDNLSSGQIASLKDKNGNYYTVVGGVSIMIDGKVAGGEWVDVIRFIDWLQARIQERIFGSVVRLDKIPYTDGGIAIVDNDLKSVLKDGQDVGGIAADTVDANGNPLPGFTTTFPRAFAVSANDKAARTLTGSFTAKLAGAIHAVTINGTVTL